MWSGSTIPTSGVDAKAVIAAARFEDVELGVLELAEHDSFRAGAPTSTEACQGPSLVTFVPDGAGQVSALRLFGVTFLRSHGS